MALLLARRFGPLFATQALGALNDNLFKNALVVLILFGKGAAGGPALVAIAGGVFILPYVLFSATAGQIADKYEKARSIRLTKLWELGLMAVAAAGFLLGSVPLLFGVLFGLGVQATFFGPLKYSILPFHLAPAELVEGNGLIEAGTFGGILVGTLLGSVLIALPGGAWITAAAGLLVAGAGIGSAWGVPRAAAADPRLPLGRNPWVETWRVLRAARASRVIWRSLLALSWFWALGATVLAVLPGLVRDTLHGAPAVFTVFLAAFTIGVGAGSVLCARLLRGEVSTRFVPAAGAGLTLFLLDFAWAASRAPTLTGPGAMLASVAGLRLVADLLLLAACGGLFSVPLYATVQRRAARTEQARMVAANNILNAIAIVFSAAATAALSAASLRPAAILGIAAAANAVVAAWTWRGRSLIRQHR